MNTRRAKHLYGLQAGSPAIQQIGKSALPLRPWNVHEILCGLAAQQAVEVAANSFERAGLGFDGKSSDVRCEYDVIHGFECASGGRLGFANIEGRTAEVAALERGQQSSFVHDAAAEVLMKNAPRFMAPNAWLLKMCLFPGVSGEWTLTKSAPVSASTSLPHRLHPIRQGQGNRLSGRDQKRRRAGQTRGAHGDLAPNAAQTAQREGLAF